MAEIQTKRHPIRGALYGLLLGISGFYFWQFMIDPTFGSLGGVITRGVIALVAGIVLGVLVAYLAPARKPRGPVPAAPPAPPAPAPVAPPEPSFSAPPAGEVEAGPADEVEAGPAGEESPDLPDEDE